MTISTQQSFSGFIASEPQQSVGESGVTRFYARVGQPHFRREADGGFTELEPTFHDLVAFRSTAERALTRFAKGDRFIAEGYVNTFQSERNGVVSEREEFIAKKIGHDSARTNYEVDRTHRVSTGAPEHGTLAVDRASVNDSPPARVGTGTLGL